MSEAISYTPAGKVVEEFHASNAFVRGLMGPVGSSKSSACCLEIVSRSMEQKAYQGIRKSRWAVIRNTYPELKSTTIKTWLEWFPMTEMRYDAPITGWLRQVLNDGTKMELEVMFFPMDRPEEIGKLKSLELSGAWINEAGETAKAILDMCTQRVGRYPALKAGGPSWSGVIMDTNPPEDDHWYYKAAEKEKPKGWEFFRQPGGLIEEAGEYKSNPQAENIPNLPSGHEYYLRQLAGKSREWIKVFLMGQYGTIADGRPVYPEWNDEIHSRTVTPYPDLPLILGFDYGLTPACVICQISPRGEFLVLSELCSKDMGIRQFANDIVKPFIAVNYHGFQFQAVGDPAGMSRSDTDEKTCFMELAEAGIPAVPAASNTFTARREAVAGYLNRLVSGRPIFALDPSCDRLRRGFNGRYQYRRLQVVGADRFKDVPDKNDYSHCFVGNTLVDTPSGRRPISRIKEGDFVITPLGPRRVTATMSRGAKEFACVKFDGGEVLSTQDHPFIVPHGVVFADCLQYNDVLIGINTQEEQEWARKWGDPQSIRFRNSTASGITESAKGITKPTSETTGAFGICTATFGSFITALFLTGLKFIIRTTTRAITKFQTLKSWMAESTLPTTAGNALLKILPPPLLTWSAYGPLLPNGTHLRLAESGIQYTASAHGRGENQSNSNASTVGSYTQSWTERVREAFALLPAKVRRAENRAWTTSKENARCVLRLLKSINTQRLKPALRVAGVSLWETQSAVKVYDLTVEDAHCFYANGVLVHNCHDALQYAALHSQTMNNSKEWSSPIQYPDKHGVV